METDPDGTGSLSSPVTSYAYNLAGWMTSETDPLGGVTTVGYDTLGRRTSITQPDPDAGGSLSAPVTSYEYNGRGLLAKVVDPLSHQTTLEYDEGSVGVVQAHLGLLTGRPYRLPRNLCRDGRNEQGR